MKLKFLPILSVVIGVLLVTAALVLANARPVNAQCKEPSTCRTCHEVQGQKPVRSEGIWHSQHAAFDFCAVCHGGDKKAAVASAAHQGMVLKLEDMSANCQNCHSADLEQRYAVYASLLGADASAPPAAASSNNALSQFLGEKPANVGAPAPAGTSASDPAQPGPNTGNIILSGVLAALVLGGGSYVIWNERRASRRSGLNLRQWLLGMLRREHWSPYAAGVLLGLVGILAVVVGNHLLGASGAISTLASTLLDKIAPVRWKKACISST